MNDDAKSKAATRCLLKEHHSINIRHVNQDGMSCDPAAAAWEAGHTLELCSAKDWWRDGQSFTPIAD